MKRTRLLIAGFLTAIAATTAADVSAQECPDWLRWACPDDPPSSTAVPQTVQPGQSEQRSRRPKQPRPAGTKQQLMQVPGGAPPATAGRQAPSSEPAGERRVARKGERQTARPTMNDQEKEILFQQFIEWRKEHRSKSDGKKTESNR
jgi:hypothetical protein